MVTSTATGCDARGALVLVCGCPMLCYRSSVFITAAIGSFPVLHHFDKCLYFWLCVFVSMYVCVSMCVCVRFGLCVCIRVCLYVCIYMCYVYIHVCMYAYRYICVYTCVHARKHLSLPGYVGVHAPILLYVFSCYPILLFTKRWPVSQLRLPPAACQGYIYSLHVPSAVSGRQCWALSFCFQLLFTSLRILLALSPCFFSSCTHFTGIVSSLLHMAPSKSAVTSHLYSFAGILRRCTFWRRVIRNSGRNMPVMKAVLYFFSAVTSTPEK